MIGKIVFYSLELNLVDNKKRSKYKAYVYDMINNSVLLSEQVRSISDVTPILYGVFSSKDVTSNTTIAFIT